MNALNKFKDKKTGISYDFKDTVARESIEELRSQIHGGPASGGTVELIESFTLAEDSIISRAAEPDGTQYNFKSIFIRLTTAAETFSGSNVTFFNQNQKIGIAWVNSINASGTRYAFLALEPKDGYWFNWQSAWNTDQAVGSVTVNRSSNFVVNKVADYPTINSIKSVNAFPAGTLVEIFAVRPNSSTDVNVSITGASVGQTIKIAAVDENGVPTAWEPADLPSNENGEYELIEKIICDGTQSIYTRNNLALKEVEIYIQTEVNETAASVGVELTNGSALFGYAWLGNLINTTKKYVYLHGVSNGHGNAYLENTAPGTTVYTTTTLNRTPTKFDGTTPIRKISIYGSSNAIFPADTIIEIYGIRA